MAVPDQAQTQPPQQSHVARDSALAAVGASLLPPVSAAAAGALSVTAIAQATTALLTALRRFQNQREQGFQDELRTEALRKHPNSGSVIDEVIGRELGYEASFRQKQFDRVQAELGPALAIQDPAQREQAVKRIFDRERRFTKMREQAMRVRVLAALQHAKLEQASPDGALWMLGENVQNHTPDCVAMAGHFWPWSVLHDFQPPVHNGCACYLVGKDQALDKGMISQRDVLDPVVAAAKAAARLRAASKLMHAGVTSEDVTHALVESKWTMRYPKGTEKAGQFRPKAGGDPGAEILRKLGLRQRGESSTPVLPRGTWASVGGRRVRIPHDADWTRQLGGVTYHSPAGTTQVFRDNTLIPTTHQPDDSVRKLADEIRDARRGQIVQRGGQPLRKGDRPHAVMAMSAKGYDMTAVRPLGAGQWKISYIQPHTGTQVHAKVNHYGVKSAEWDTSPIPAQQEHRAVGAPRSFGEHVADAHAWARSLGERYGAPVKLGAISQHDALEDHAGFHEFSGETYLGKDVRPDIERAGRARAAGRALTDDEKRGVYAAMHVTAHELGHAVNPIAGEDFHGEHANLEEALTEEMAHHLAVARLRSQGQHDVARWAEQHPDDLTVRGPYRRERGALGEILDVAHVTDANDRLHVIENLKFNTHPRDRISALAQMVAAEHPEVTSEHAEQWVREKMQNGGNPGSATGLASKPHIPAKLAKWYTKAAAEQDKKREELAKEPIQTGGAKGSQGGGQQYGFPFQSYKPPPKLDPAKYGATPHHKRIPTPIVRLGTQHGPSLTLGGKGRVQGTHDAKDDEGGKWIVSQHKGDADHVASELLANRIYHALGIPAVDATEVSTPGAPDFSQIPDAIHEDALPETGRLSTGVIIRAPNGKITLIEPRNHYGGYVHTFPKGGVEDGLSPQQNALKELWEETGLHAHITGVVGDFKGDTGTTRYYLGVLTGGEPTPSNETAAIKTVTMKQAATMLNRERDKEVLTAVMKAGVPKGSFEDNFPETVPGVAVAYPKPEGKSGKLTKPSKKFAAGFMADALIGNWDPVGSYGDNLAWPKEGPPVRLNHQGVFEFRPSGGHKEFGGVPSEAWDLLRKGQANGTVDLSDEELRAQARKIADTMTDGKIDAMVAQAPFRDEAMRQRVAESLKQRVAWMRDYADGKEDMPTPPTGAEARALLKDAQTGPKTALYPEEEKAFADYYDPTTGPAIRAYMLGDRKKAPDETTARVVKHLDNVMRDFKTPSDVTLFMPVSKPLSKGVVGETVKQKHFAAAMTDEDKAREAPAMIRLLVPGGSHAYFTGAGDHDVLFGRDSRMRITAVKEENGKPVYEAMLLPQQTPGTLYQKPYTPKPYKPYTPPKGGSEWLPKNSQSFKFLEGDHVTMNGMDGQIVKMNGSTEAHVKMADTGKTYVVPTSSITFVRGGTLNEAWSETARERSAEVRHERAEARESALEPAERPWHEPPVPTGTRGQRKGGGLTAVGVTNTALGDAVEHALAKHMGFEDAHPGRRQGPFDLKFGQNAYEVKAVSRSASEYKAKPKAHEIAGKKAYAEEHGLNPHTMIVVYDNQHKQIHAYSRPGVGAYRLKSQAQGWKYHGSLPLDLGDHPDPVAHLQEALFDLLEAEQTNTGAMVALYPEPETAKKLALKGGEPASELHVTLGYLGKADDLDDLGTLHDKVAEWAKRTPPLEGEVSGHGLFTAGEAPVTYVSPDLPDLPKARQDLVDALESTHPVRKEHGYTPHITLHYRDRLKDLPDHGGMRLKFSHAALVLGDHRADFKLEGKR